jgi:inner membrane protein
MFVFAHAGITLGAAALVAGALDRRQVSPNEKISWFTSLSRRVDIRVLLVGSLLPDIIDKPVGQYFFRETFSNGRIFSHTLLFLIVLAGIGFYLFKRHRQVWMLTLAAGTFAHLLMDEMWLFPETLFWPLLGFTFTPADLTEWFSNIFQALFREAHIFIPELVGLAVLLWFGLSLAFRKKVGIFLKYGRTY